MYVGPLSRATIANITGKAFRRNSLIAFNTRHENILEVIGIVEDPIYHGFSLVSPWMENGNLVKYLKERSLESVDRLQLVSKLHQLNPFQSQFTLYDARCMTLHVDCYIFTN